ncbi:unnamed protein product [Miscanthus lutarioriparius]|uniref:RING-type E3 ubiquitin transferase (cysteine targeting) n=1 Tax=Miscanthus lutarioriparius TaxID=422564 RepID=A0A811RAG1_9POAL|nr:unnamed protein product [Miscanthus lutarioriparius]
MDVFLFVCVCLCWVGGGALVLVLEQAWKDLGFLFLKRYFIVLALLVANIYGHDFSAFRRWGDSEQRPLARRAWALMQNAEVLYRAASFFNLLLFLYGGRYKTIVERILKARLVYGGPNMNRAVSFEYMNGQLVWNEFSMEKISMINPWNDIFTKSKMSHCYHDSNAACMTLVS